MPLALRNALTCPVTLSRSVLSVLSVLSAPSGLSAQTAVSNLRYELTFDSTTSRSRSLGVTVRFDVSGAGPVLLSFPAWTPGAYEISNFAREVSQFAATSGGRALQWDKLDYDTWRVRPEATGTVEVRFSFLADTLDNAMAWSKPDFLLVNGTNVFPYPEGMGLDFPATVAVRTEPGWRVVTGMHPAGPRQYDARNYHDLVDMPFFIGHFDLDSAQIESHWHRLASYPAGLFRGPARDMLWSQLKGILPAESRVFQETPWESYNTMLIFDSAYGGGSALEHQNSHVGIYNPGFIGTAVLASISAHEIFHSWNVKRLRPKEMTPYRYDAPQPTTLLWVSEGITDYYADLALVRGGVIDSATFLNVTTEKIQEVAAVPPVALEDASLSTWIHPTDGTASIYYPKGSLAGLLLDILIRDASDNRCSLDEVLRSLYKTDYQAGRGFTVEEFWSAVSAAAGGRSFAEFSARYVDGREPFPWETVAPLAGIRLLADTTRDARLGVSALGEGKRVVVSSVQAGSAAAAAGVEPGDELVSVGDIKITDLSFGDRFRSQYGRQIGTKVPLVVKRGEKTLTLQVEVREVIRVDQRLALEPKSSPKAARIRGGILRGTLDR